MLLDLFLCFVQVGLFSIGGGYAAMPMIQAKAVEYYHWLTMSEFTDLMTIAEMTPGPRPAVVALIASAALTILRVVVFAGGVISVSTVQVLYVALFIIALAVLRIRHSNPILVMVCCGAVSLAAKLILG